MGIIASCGHRVGEVDDLHNIATKAWDIGEEGWVKAIHYSSVCEDCFKEYEGEGSILYTEEEEINWLNTKEEE